MDSEKEASANQKELDRKYFEEPEKYLEELNADKEELFRAFRKFSKKYEYCILGFTIIKLSGRWELRDIIVSGDRPETSPSNKLPFMSLPTEAKS